MKPHRNGLVTLHDERTQERGFFCMKLVAYLNEEAELATPEYEKLWHERFSQAKSGMCHYADKCPIYARTNKKPRQLTLCFD